MKCAVILIVRACTAILAPFGRGMFVFLIWYSIEVGGSGFSSPPAAQPRTGRLMPSISSTDPDSRTASSKRRPVFTIDLLATLAFVLLNIIVKRIITLTTQTLAKFLLA